MVLAVGVFGLSLSTVVKVPTLTGWKLAVVATQFGHWIALGAALLFVVSIRRAGRQSRRGWRVAAGLSGTAAILLLVPAGRAWWIARALPLDLQAALGPARARASTQRPFSWGTLYRFGGEQPAKIETHVFSSGENFALTLTAYGPAHGDDTNRPLPAIVLIHGGGWDGGTRDELPGFSGWLTSLGFAVFAIDYRLAPQWKWPAPRDDARNALLWLGQNRTQLGIDPDRIVLFGRSAGAQIALAVAYDPASPPVRGVIAFYGPADLRFAYEYGREDDVLKSPGLLRAHLGGTPAEQPGAYDEASPFFQVRSGAPPTLLVHGQLDTLVWHRQSERLAARLREAGGRHFFLSLPAATHALEYNLHSPGGQLACAAVAQFLETVD